MRRLFIASMLGLAAVALAEFDAADAAQDAARDAVAGLARVYDTDHGVVRDTNGDGLPDLVAARVIVSDQASVEDVQVAANLAARIGFETVALSLPFVHRSSQTGAATPAALPILVGRTVPEVKAWLDRGEVDLKALEKGQGVIAFVRSPQGGPDGVIVVGVDDAGTLAAGNTLAASLPRLWGASGSRLRDVEDDVRAAVQSGGVVVTGRPALMSIVVDAERRGLKSIRVRVEIAAAAVARSRVALEALDLAHRRGREPGVLNFANVAETIVELWTAGARAGEVVVRRSGPNARSLTPPDEQLTGRGGGAGGPVAAGAGAGPVPVAEAPGAAGGQTGEAAASFDLQSAYTIDGWLGDAYPDLMADRVDASILIGHPAEGLGAAHIAARLGLESTGIAVPIARRAADVADPSREPSPILVGRDNVHVQSLVKIGRARLDGLTPGDGVIQVVPRAFGSTTATVVAGADPAGTDAAALYLARRAPYLWDVRRGALTLEHLEEQIADFFGARSGAGQAALAVTTLEDIAKTLADKTDVTGLEVKAFLDEPEAGLDKMLASALQPTPGGTLPVKVDIEAVTAPATVFEETIEIPWEVDEVRAKFKSEVLPKVQAGAAVMVDVRVSESPEVRRALADEFRQALTLAGAVSPGVQVRSAYKSGFLWMTEEVVPALRDKAVASIHVKVAEHVPDFSKKFRFYTMPSRWLHELYPIDEVFLRDLGVPLAAFSMELVQAPANTYDVEARDRRGRVVHRAVFSPRVVEREYLEKFPGWSRVEVTTGGLQAVVNGTAVVDVRIATDPERFWDHYQGKVLPRIHDHVMRLTDNRPTSAKQPFHRDLDVEVWMSEPDFRIGVDEEQVSALESLHEDLYFGTLDFYRALGRNTTRETLSSPGKIYPIIHPERRGRAGTARVLYAANAAPRPRVEVSYKDKDIEKPVKVSRDLTRVDVGDVTSSRIVARVDRVREIEVGVAPPGDREALRAVDQVDALTRLHAAGLYLRAWSFEHVDAVAVSVGLRDARTRRVVARTGQIVESPVRTAAPAPAAPLVTWDHVIGPDESEAIVRQLAAFPGISAYRAGRSYRGRDISVLEITSPTPSELISVTKYTAYKPTIFITGRQHANEVSSTSHILRLAELLATDPAYRARLARVNVVLHPVENPDGAAMAYELQKLTPTHMLHAGRYSALGSDVGGGGGGLLPESRVRGRIWREWRPDIYLNPHGYPSHEWVQQFAGYVSPQFRSYWSSRGWYTQLSGLRDPRYPAIATATEALRDSIARALTADADVRRLNLAHQDRYRRWAHGFASFIFGQEIYEDAAIYYTDPETGEFRGGRRVPVPGNQAAFRATMGQWPTVTFNSGMTEAPDETAQGPWLDLVTRMGFSFITAHVAYLHDGQAALELVEEGAARDGVTRTRVRVRPVLPRK